MSAFRHILVLAAILALQLLVLPHVHSGDDAPNHSNTTACSVCHLKHCTASRTPEAFKNIITKPDITGRVEAFVQTPSLSFPQLAVGPRAPPNYLS